MNPELYAEFQRALACRRIRYENPWVLWNEPNDRLLRASKGRRKP